MWDDPSVQWADVPLVVVRSTWDYAERRDAFLAWCAAVPRVLNSVPVITWNTDKAYLRTLAAAGIPIVPTLWIATDSSGAGTFVLPDGDLVVKPSISSGAQHTSRYRGGDQGRSAKACRTPAQGGTRRDGAAVRQLRRHRRRDRLSSTSTARSRMRSARGRCSAPRASPPISSGQSRTSPPGRRTPTSGRLAEAVLDALPWPRDELLYARVDVVRGGDGAPLLLELELAEPSLFLGLGSGCGCAARGGHRPTHRARLTASG